MNILGFGHWRGHAARESRKGRAVLHATLCTRAELLLCLPHEVIPPGTVAITAVWTQHVVCRAALDDAGRNLGHPPKSWPESVDKLAEALTGRHTKRHALLDNHA